MAARDIVTQGFGSWQASVKYISTRGLDIGVWTQVTPQTSGWSDTSPDAGPWTIVTPQAGGWA